MNYKYLTYLITCCILPVSQFDAKLRYIERLPTIAELVISSYLTISQQFLVFKKLSFVGDTTGFKTDRKPLVYSSICNSAFQISNLDATGFILQKNVCCSAVNMILIN